MKPHAGVTVELHLRIDRDALLDSESDGMRGSRRRCFTKLRVTVDLAGPEAC